MRIIVEALGRLQRFLPEGQRRIELEVEENSTVGEVLLKLGIEVNEPWNASLDGKLANPSDIVSDKSVLLVFPPIAGGD